MQLVRIAQLIHKSLITQILIIDFFHNFFHLLGYRNSNMGSKMGVAIGKLKIGTIFTM